MDDLSLGGEPRRRVRIGRRGVLAGTGLVIVLAGVATLLTLAPWRTEPTTALVVTGDHCIVGYGTDLVVVAVRMTNNSAQASTTVEGIALGPHAAHVARAGGPIDVVTAQGCEHVLGLRGDLTAPGADVWLGLTVAVTTCDRATVPLVVSFDGGAGIRDVPVDVALAPNVAPSCTDWGHVGP